MKHSCLVQTFQALFFLQVLNESLMERSALAISLKRLIARLLSLRFLEFKYLLNVINLKLSMSLRLRLMPIKPLMVGKIMLI